MGQALDMSALLLAIHSVLLPSLTDHVSFSLGKLFSINSNTACPTLSLSLKKTDKRPFCFCNGSGQNFSTTSEPPSAHWQLNFTTVSFSSQHALTALSAWAIYVSHDAPCSHLVYTPPTLPFIPTYQNLELYCPVVLKLLALDV